MKNPLHFRAEGFEFGAGKEARTPDPNLGKVVLYQLSYSRLMHFKNGIPKGIRTPVTAVKGRCPRPLDDGDVSRSGAHSIDGPGVRQPLCEVFFKTGLSYWFFSNSFSMC